MTSGSFDRQQIRDRVGQICGWLRASHQTQTASQRTQFSNLRTTNRAAIEVLVDRYSRPQRYAVIQV